MNEQEAIEQLKRYRQMQARMQILNNYSVGAGITVSRLQGDDQLQDLHRRLRGLPSYMYLSGKEQRLESAAHAYLTQYPAGVKSQLAVIPEHGSDAEDDKLLRELRDKIGRVFAARGYDVRDDLDAVLDRLAEYQDLQDEILRLDNALAALELYKPNYGLLLRLRYVEDKSYRDVAAAIGIAERTYRAWHAAALQEYVRLTG